MMEDLCNIGRLGCRHIHKEINLQEGMDGIDNILFKSDLNFIPQLATKYQIYT